MKTNDTSLMARKWESFAREDPMHAIATSRSDWTDEAFHESGRAVTERLIRWIGPEHPRKTVLEIGCGLCRTLKHMAGHFEQASGIDIAPSMIDKARASGLPGNIQLHVGSGADLSPIGDETQDFIYSLWVMQHIPDPKVIASYLSEIRRTLKPDGRVAIQFDTRPATLLSKIYEKLPDLPLFPKSRRCLRRYRLNSHALLRMVEQAGLEILEGVRPDTVAHFLLMQKAAHSEPNRP